MAARFAHAGATPTTLDLQLHEMTTRDVVPKTHHQTPTGAAIGRYVHGTRYRVGDLLVKVRTATEHDNFLSFHRTAMNANTRFTFTADVTNFPGDTWSAFFMTEPVFERLQAGAKIIGAFRFQIEDVPVAL